MNVDGPRPIISETDQPMPPHGPTMFNAEIRLYDALGLVKRAADAIDALQKWKDTVEPQALSLIRRIQQERRGWQVERTALIDEITESRLTITATQDALRMAVSEREMLVRRYREAQAVAIAFEERACAAEAMLAFVYQSFSLELCGDAPKGSRVPTPRADAGMAAASE